MCAWVTAGCCPCCLIVARGFGFVHTTLLRQGVVGGVVCSFGGSGGAECRPRRCLWVSSEASSEFGRSQVWIRIFFLRSCLHAMARGLVDISAFSYQIRAFFLLSFSLKS